MFNGAPAVITFRIPTKAALQVEWNVHSPCISDSLLVVQILTA